MYALLLCSLVACGGADEALKPGRAQAASHAAPAPAAAPGLTANGPSLAAALGNANGTPMTASPPVAEHRQLGSNGRVVLYGPGDLPPPASPWPTAAPESREYHVDSQLGRDDYDGRSPDTAWRTLRRLASAPLAPGDQVMLACGSVWRETLQLATSGSATRPIVVRAAGACGQAPAIDGSLTLDATAWSRSHGAVYQTMMAEPPLQLFSDAGAWVAAHHPNRNDNGPRYLALVADGDIAVSGGREVSTRLQVGDDLVLPAGASLAQGTRVRVRTAAYVIDDLAVASLDGRTLTLAAPTTYPVKAGWGYLLTGQPWMVDSAGEWVHDATSGRLLAHAMGDAAAPQLPTSATVLKLGIDLGNRDHVVIDGLAVRKVGTGAWLRGGQGLVLRNCVIEDTADRGIDAANSRAVVIESNRIERTGEDALFAGGMVAAAAEGLVARDNHIRQSGVLMAGDAVLSLPRRSYGAILAGRAASVSGNRVIDSAYIGIRVFENSRVQRNVVIGSCTILDDCGAIYTLGAGNQSSFTDNLVLRVRGNPAGKPMAARAAQAQGIYLDDDASDVTVARNTVIDADHGLQLHDVSGNQIQGNRLYGNRVAQLWLQETRRLPDGSGTTVGNRIVGNQLVPVHALSRAMLLETVQSSAAALGHFDHNRYFDATPGRLGTVATSGGAIDVGPVEWFTWPGLASAAPADGAGSATSTDGSAGYAVLTANLVPNGDLVSSASGWSQWSAAAPSGSVQVQTCGGSPCLRFVSGGAPSLLSSPNFSLDKGRWYRLSVDLASLGPTRPVQLVVRRGGGGNNGYERLADRNLALTVGPELARHSLVFQASGSVRAADPNTGDLGARIDVEGLSAGQALLLARLELVPIALADSALLSVALVNAGSAAIDAPCPLPAQKLDLCGQMVDLADAGAVLAGRTVSWPLRLDPTAAVILHVRDPALIDSDGDGIADFQDQCPATSPRQTVNARGCAFGQR